MAKTVIAHEFQCPHCNKWVLITGHKITVKKAEAGEYETKFKVEKARQAQIPFDEAPRLRRRRKKRS